MIEKWFNNDIEQHMSVGHRVVVCDARSDGAFLMKYLRSDIRVINVKNELEELEARYEVEKYHKNNDVVFYVVMPKDKLKFLLEFAQTGGLIDLTDMELYTKQRLFVASGTNATVDGKNLVMAAKLSVGKDLNWWKGVATGITQPFNLHDYIVNFICQPTETVQGMDVTVRNVFTEEVYKLIGKQKTSQTPDAMAREIMNSIFEGLLKNTLSNELLQLYYTLTDRNSAQQAVNLYVEGFVLPADSSPLIAHPDHPFVALDRKLTKMLSDALKNDADISACLHAVKERIRSKHATVYKAEWLMDLVVLFSYEINGIHMLNTLDEFAIYYRTQFCKVDRAMRQLYVAWLNNPDTLRPIQYYYEQLSKELQDKWYALAKDYRPTQQGLVVDALQKAGKVAVIVGDGLRLEIAEVVADEIKGNPKRATAFAELPSVTERGMSALYNCEEVEITAQTRFAHLKTLVPSVEIISLDNLNDSVTADKLILTFGDIDQVGEKKQLAGLKDISGYQHLLVEKIKQLLSKGYSKVYLTTDHGFVITGILDEADKIPVPSGTDIKVYERFILSSDPIDDVHLIERKEIFGGYAYQYYARTDKPFVSRGTYGYAHGGLTPQECIIPMYCFLKEESTEVGCNITIVNKNDLMAVTGNYFTLKIKAEGDASNLFASSRKVKVQLFDQQGNTISSSIEMLQADSVLSKEMEITTAPCKLVIIDFKTTEQLDHCVVDRSHVRDIDDLF